MNTGSKKPDGCIRGILLDVDGTLYYHMPVRVLTGLSLILNNIHKPSEMVRKIRIIRNYRNAQEMLRQSLEIKGGLNSNQIMITAGFTNEDPSYIEKIIKEWFERKPGPFIRLCRRRGLKRTLYRWHRKNMKLGVLSDYPAAHKLKALGIEGYIDTVVSSGDPEIGRFKPHSSGFLAAARKMGLEPSEILYVGDRPEVDGVGASRAGMRVAILGSRTNMDKHGYIPVTSFKALLAITDESFSPVY